MPPLTVRATNDTPAGSFSRNSTCTSLFPVLPTVTRTSDNDFSRFKGLRWESPIGE